MSLLGRVGGLCARVPIGRPLVPRGERVARPSRRAGVSVDSRPVKTFLWMLVFGALLVGGAVLGLRYLNQSNGCVKSPATGRCAETQFSP